MKTTYLIDTYVLVYALNLDSKFNVKSYDILNDALNGKTTAALADKSLFEFFAIITDSKRIEKPVSIDEAWDIIKIILKSKIEILYTSANSITITFELAKKYNVSRQKVFDLVLVGIMLDNGIKQICTHNKKDFDYIDEIEVFYPK
jgi:predicted nucleic acid-binding protein